MIRNLVLKLPSLKCTSEYAFSSLYRKRSFRSLSPIQRLRSDASAVAERSVSCSRAERGNSPVDISGKPPARALCFSKEYYAKVQQPDASEVQWKENSVRLQEAEPLKGESDFTKSDSVHFETLEQYELEAARPRPSKSRDVFDAFALQYKRVDRYTHLQPNQMKPYGSSDNLYSPMLIRPTNSLKYPKKLKRQMTRETTELEPVGSTETPAKGQRNFSTATHSSEETRKISTTKKCVSKEGDSTKDKHSSGIMRPNEQLRFPNTLNLSGYRQFSKQQLIAYQNSWAMRSKFVDFSPPSYQALPKNLVEQTDELPLKISTPAMRKERKEAENRQGSIHYRSSYSDIIKCKLQEEQTAKMGLNGNLLAPCDALKMCNSYSVATPSERSDKMLENLKSIPSNRTITTRSKSNINCNEKSVLTQQPLQQIELSGEFVSQRNYSRAPKNKKKSKKSDMNKSYDPECDNVCAPFIRSFKKSKSPRFPYEPAKCEQEHERRKSVYLPSKVKLPVDPCLQRPEYRDCKPDTRCTIERADECLEIGPKQLPKLRTGPCPCIDPPVPTVNPKLERLQFKFEDPPKVICHPPTCDVPRADDDNPYKFKPLKPYVPQVCECVEPPPMYNVKLKRLPRCEPEEICRPVRVCPVIDLCPERADKCFKVVPKRLPLLPDSPCPCIDTPPPAVAPPIKRLDLHVPEPERVCPPPRPCDEVQRADDNLKQRRKKLPKFVPGDCPCEDKPMIDWNLKRLVCEDEPRDCIVPDPCRAFPRADWGCWEYTQDVCEDVDEKCLPPKPKCEKPKKEKPCRKPSICENAGAGVLDYRNVSKRKYSNASSSSSLKLYQRMKSTSEKTTSRSAASKPTSLSSSQPTRKSTQFAPKLKGTSKKSANAPALQLVKLLNQLETTSNRESQHLLFKPEKVEKVDYNHILKTIASTTAELEKKEIAKTNAMAAQTLKKPKQTTLRVTSRAISTTEHSHSETEMKKKKECQAKEKCKKIKPSLKAIMCKKSCPKYHVCHDADNERECRPFCKMERVPVCCEKEESPYTAYSDNLNREIQPYTHTKTPQWTCNRKQYGFHPVYKKEHDVPNSDKTKNLKRYSTSTLLAELPPTDSVKRTDNHSTSPYRRESSSAMPKTKSSKSRQTARPLTVRSSNASIYQPPSKVFLKKTAMPNLSSNHSRSFTTKIFQIRFPEPCKKPKGTKESGDQCRQKISAPKITCKTEDICVAEEGRRCCYRDFKSDPNTVRRPPPFPAFSDCLDEEMEDILTECPLDKEKFHRMQPRFKQPPPQLLISPPPSQGKIDLMKEQECLREKLCMENEGVTQSCKDFGKPIPLMETKEMVQEVNRDCLIQEQLKTMKGRWPPRNLKQNRHLPHPKPITKPRDFSTFSAKTTGEINKKPPAEVKRIYVRKFHALIKNTDKAVLGDNIDKLKEITQKVFPNMDDTTKVVRLKDKLWRLQHPKIFQYLKRQNKVARRVTRCYTTFKSRRHWRISKLLKSINSARRFSRASALLKSTGQYYRGRRYLKVESKPNGAATRDKCKKKSFSKFTLNGCPPRLHRKICQRTPTLQDSARPISPYPAFSECHPDERITPACECGHEVGKRPDLQPRFSALRDSTTIVKDYPAQERIDRGMGVEYYKCKNGLGEEGQTIGCDPHGDYFNSKSGPNSKDANDCDSSAQKSAKNPLFEFLVQSHRKGPLAELEETTCCSQSPKSPSQPDPCDLDRKKIEDICIKECIKTIPCDLPEEEKYCICRDSCKTILDCKEKCEAQRNLQAEEKRTTDACTDQPNPKTECDKAKKKIVKKICSPKPPCPPKPTCKNIAVKPVCGPKKSKSFTQLESVWQKIVNYFKARPNCPQPGDYKKKSLKQKAEKAADAAGLVVIDPNCLPPDLRKTFKATKKDCKICPNQEPKEPVKAGNTSTFTKPINRNFSTNFQEFRDYSKSCNNLEEINKLLEESEINQRKLKMGISSCCLDREFAIFPERKGTDESEAIKLSLDMQLYKRTDLADLCYEGGKYKRTYFGYSNIIPSRENILERAWRISIEANNKYNYPTSCNLFNEIFSKLENSIKTAEDLEKLKTESVLKELDELLKSQDLNTNKKKK
uniref:Uncharacterized protein n=1 Tax=Dendroctonus ponderosae TaxID=77166 RepID=A0AAR5QI35_DENPD